ncbi:uncharacterized protein DFL_003358 [Arthrobotrys flagrans]|uniref:Uncharacterized protein n=1 Tax=Arthrobotrys flagrans TaxID=97331 RepID=A0A437A1M1_ARTFL|nr:hypothetical protein DFL_003358 [Arthrobotrys flagrans]
MTAEVQRGNHHHQPRCSSFYSSGSEYQTTPPSKCHPKTSTAPPSSSGYITIDLLITPRLDSHSNNFATLSPPPKPEHRDYLDYMIEKLQSQIAGLIIERDDKVESKRPK